MLFVEIITVYSENCTRLINTLHGQNAGLDIFKAGDTYIVIVAI
jgi:hypothetical protein